MLTLAEYKAMKNITGNDQDVRIESYIEFVLEYLNQFTGWTKITILEMVDFHLKTSVSKTSESLGDYSASYNTEYPTYITKGLKRKARVI